MDGFIRILSVSRLHRQIYKNHYKRWQNGDYEPKVVNNSKGKKESNYWRWSERQRDRVTLTRWLVFFSMVMLYARRWAQLRLLQQPPSTTPSPTSQVQLAPASQPRHHTDTIDAEGTSTAKTSGAMMFAICIPSKMDLSTCNHRHRQQTNRARYIPTTLLNSTRFVCHWQEPRAEEMIKFEATCKRNGTGHRINHGHCNHYSVTVCQVRQVHSWLVPNGSPKES